MVSSQRENVLCSTRGEKNNLSLRVEKAWRALAWLPLHLDMTSGPLPEEELHPEEPIKRRSCKGGFESVTAAIPSKSSLSDDSSIR